MNLQCLCLVVLPLANSCNMHELKIEVLLFGDDTLTEMQNLQIFKSVKRFTHLWSRYLLPFFFKINPVASISHTSMKKNAYTFFALYNFMLIVLYFLCFCFFIFHKNLFIMLYIVIYYCWRMYYCNYLLCGEDPCKLL